MMNGMVVRPVGFFPWLFSSRAKRTCCPAQPQSRKRTILVAIPASHAGDEIAGTSDALAPVFILVTVCVRMTMAIS